MCVCALVGVLIKYTRTFRVKLEWITYLIYLIFKTSALTAHKHNTN